MLTSRSLPKRKVFVLPDETAVERLKKIMFFEGHTTEFNCQFCNSNFGHIDLLEEDIWFCCHSCRDQGEPCETFFEDNQQEE